MVDLPHESRPARSLVGSTVLQVVPALQGDAFGHGVLDIAVGLLRAGARSLVGGGGGALVGELQALGGEWLALDLSMVQRLRGRRALQDFIKFLAVERVDLVHAHGPDAAACALPAAKAARAGLLTSYWGAPPPPAWGRPLGDAQAHGDLVLACSHFAADAIAARHRVPRERMVVIPHSVDMTVFDPAAVAPERVTALEQAWRIHPEARVVLVPGKIAAARGHFVLIDAVRSLVNGGLRGVVFVLAGGATDAAYAAAVDGRIHDQGLSGIVRRVGRCTDMPAAYALAELVVIPTERAAVFSTAAIEAQAMGRPVIASALGALPELVLVEEDERGAQTGWLVPPQDALALARTIARALMLDFDELDRMGAEARAFATGVFSPEQIAGAVLDVHRGLARPSAVTAARRS